MKNFKLDYNIPEDMIGNSKRVTVKYSDDQDINEPIIYTHYNNEYILKGYISGKVEVNPKYRNLIDKEKLITIVEVIKGFASSVEENNIRFCTLKVSLMFAYTSLICEDVEYYETHKNDPKFIKRVEELKNERNSNNR